MLQDVDGDSYFSLRGHPRSCILLLCHARGESEDRLRHQYRKHMIENWVISNSGLNNTIRRVSTFITGFLSKVAALCPVMCL
jgi:hypothetical protein